MRICFPIDRILGDPNCHVRRERAALQTVESSFDHNQNPPDYSTIVSTSNLATTAMTNTSPNHDHHEPNANTASQTNVYDNSHAPPRATHISSNNINETCPHHQTHQISNVRRHTTTNFPPQKSLEKMDSFSSTMPRRQNPAAISSASPNERHNFNFRNLTAHDVAQLLRSTPNAQLIRSETNLDPLPPTTANSERCADRNTGLSIADDDDDLHSNGQQEQEDFSFTRSVEELILNEVPVGESNAAATFCDK